MDEIENTKQFLIAEHLVAKSEFMGCSEKEIYALGLSQGIAELPLAYKRYLALMGRGAGLLTLGQDCCYDDLISGGLRCSLNKMLFYHGVESLRSDAFVFRSDQGVQYYFFVCGEDNPVVRYVWESRNPFPELDGIDLIVSPFKFTDFLQKKAMRLLELKQAKDNNNVDRP